MEGATAFKLDLEGRLNNNEGDFARKMSRHPRDVIVPIDVDEADDGTLSNGPSSGNQAELEPWDAWLPLTESRNGSTTKAVFHAVSAGIGMQSLLLPVALATLGWTFGVLILTVAFTWQLYTIWILVHLHEFPTGVRNSRYLLVMFRAFGPKLGKLLGIVPLLYLSGGTCFTLISTGGRAMQTLSTISCADAETCHGSSLSLVEWFLVFTCIAIAVGQLPNLNSLAGVSFIGAVTGFAYCTIIWVWVVQKGPVGDVSHEPLMLAAGKSGLSRAGNVLNAIGMIAIAFRGHNLVLEIQGTLPSSKKGPTDAKGPTNSEGPMWRAVLIAYSLISLCFYPLAIAGFWAYGNKIPSGGILSAISDSNTHHASKLLLGFVNVLVIINSLCMFQIYAMPVFDNLEIRYTAITGRSRCPPAARVCLRLFFGGLVYFISVAFPFILKLGALLGGLTAPVTYAYPCLMWVLIKKPRRKSVAWYFNWSLGCLGLILGAFLMAAALRSLILKGLHANFFKP